MGTGCLFFKPGKIFFELYENKFATSDDLLQNELNAASKTVLLTNLGN
jgi:hypothetical protein